MRRKLILRLRLDDSASQVLLDCLMQRKNKKPQPAVAEKAPEDDTASPLTGKEMAARKAWLPPKHEEEPSAKKPGLSSILKKPSVAPQPKKACEDGAEDFQRQLEAEIDTQIDEVKDEPKDEEKAETPAPPSKYAKANSTSHRTEWMKMTRRFECEDARAKWPEIAKLWDSCREAGHEWSREACVI